MKRSYLLALLGLILGLGSPFGALLLLWHFPHPNVPIPEFLTEEWRDHFFFFTYMTTGTCLAFTLFGFWVGWDEDQVLQKNRRLTDQVLTDPLTHLGNHRFLHDSFSLEYKKQRSSGQPLSCLMMDLDHFKKVNDTYGHPFGDYVLQHFAKIIKDSIRQGDIATRYGGEEFLCILPNCDSGEALEVAERIRKGTQKYLFVQGSHRARVTVSLGCMTSQKNFKKSYQHLIQQADKALYSAKRKGRDQVVQVDGSSLLGSTKNLRKSLKPRRGSI
jgi:diguanylate cyclase (GGDEF)-like protein